MYKVLYYDLHRAHFMLKDVVYFNKLWTLNKCNTVRNYSTNHFYLIIFIRESQGYTGMCKN